MNDNQLKKIGERIRLKLREEGLTQKVFAKQLGITETSVGKILRGESNFKIMLAFRMSKTLGVSIDWIVKGPREDSRNNNIEFLSKQIDELKDDKERLYRILEGK